MLKFNNKIVKLEIFQNACYEMKIVKVKQCALNIKTASEKMALLDSKLELSKIIQNIEVEYKNAQENHYEQNKAVQSTAYCKAALNIKKRLKSIKFF